ncbi:MAG TPA: hypothetical protein VGT41_06225 [Candidatus Babeliales bacterium]|nr:hypothetical protein [Candidatus Babeliales bacterium]
MKFKYLLLIICSSSTIFAANPASDLEKALSSKKGSRASSNTQNAKAALKRLQNQAFGEDRSLLAGVNPENMSNQAMKQQMFRDKGGESNPRMNAAHDRLQSKLKARNKQNELKNAGEEQKL